MQAEENNKNLDTHIISPLHHNNRADRFYLFSSSVLPADLSSAVTRTRYSSRNKK
jgi:hypothetical protein